MATLSSSSSDSDSAEPASIEPSRDHLMGVLSNILSKSFGFYGTYAYSTTDPDAPDPCLRIDTGEIRLPLSENDAKNIIQCASSAPYGDGSRTVINKEVRDTWEIQPSSVRLNNQDQWSAFLNKSIVAICEKLGVDTSGGYPTYDFHKLLLYQTGSHFLPHQDTQKKDGMFATMVIVLPSKFTGGKVCVSRHNWTKSIDISGTSHTHTAILAWYSDVTHEVEPIKSGYRLALSYNLMNPSPGNTSRALHADAKELRTALSEWSSVTGEQRLERSMIAYMLNHHYSRSDLDKGMAGLKGEDAFKVSQIRAVAEELGYKLLLANLDRVVEGNCRDDPRTSIPEIGSEVYEDMTTLDQLVDLTGKQVVWDGYMELEATHFISGYCEPDERDFEPYTGNEGATLKHKYHRTVLILFCKDEEDQVMFDICGLEYVVDKLNSPCHPTSIKKKLANTMLRQSGACRTIYDFSLKWNDLDMWKDIVGRYDLIDIGEGRLLGAWQIFGFQTVQEGYVSVIQSADRYDRVKFIRAVRAHALNGDDKGIAEKWCKEQFNLIVEKCIREHHVRGIVEIARDEGVLLFKNIDVVRSLNCTPRPTEIVRELLKEKENILSSFANRFIGIAEAGEVLDEFIDRCLAAVGERARRMAEVLDHQIYDVAHHSKLAKKRVPRDLTDEEPKTKKPRTKAPTVSDCTE